MGSNHEMSVQDGQSDSPRFVADHTENGTPMVLDTSTDPCQVRAVCKTDRGAETLAAVLNGDDLLRRSGDR